MAVRAQFGSLFSEPPILDGDAVPTTFFADTGGVPCDWVTATPGDPVTDGVLVYVHGGGFEHTNPHLERIMTHRLSTVAGRPGIRVDYRLAPEHPFPAAIADVTAVCRSLLRHGVPAERILLAGESAGGTLVLSTLLMLVPKERPGGAIAVSAVTDFASDGSSRDGTRDVIDPGTMGHIDTQYLAGAPPDQAPQSPIYGSLRGLPPLLLAVGADEVLLEDTRRFAETASAQGVSVTLDIYEHMPHAFHAGVLFPADRRLPTANTFLDRVRRWIDGLATAPEAANAGA